MSRVRVSVRPRHFFYTRKTPKTIANTASNTQFIWMKQLLAIQRRRKVGINFFMVGRTDPSNNDNQNSDGGGLVCACARVPVCVCAGMCAGVRACVRACNRDVFAIYDNNILPRLIMIIFKIVFLYFIEIAHTDDFPWTGTRLVMIIIWYTECAQTLKHIDVW